MHDPEPGILHLQLRKNEPDKKVAMFQAISGEPEGGEISTRELELFFSEMCDWKQLDADGQAYATSLRNKATDVTPDATKEEFMDSLIYLKTVANGIQNAASHAIGELICKDSQANNKSTFETTNMIRKQAEERSYAKYKEILQTCQEKNACRDCANTLEWDVKYLR